MALKHLVLEAIRGLDSGFDFGPELNRIRAQNRGRKSTIKEALAFVFTGTDSRGHRNPTHLITKGRDAMKVTAVTDRAEIVRTLTQKGNGTLKIVRNGVATTYTQSQMEQIIGSQDLVLSAMLPEYFLNLPIEKKQKVIAEILPSDRLKLFAATAGFELSVEEQARYSLAKRADLVVTTVAQDRRELEKDLAKVQGELQAIDAIKPLEEPKEPPAVARLKRLEALCGEWKEYRRQVGERSQAIAANLRIEKENAKREVRRSELRAKLSAIDFMVVPKPLELNTEQFKDFRAKMKPEPARPAQHAVVDSERCPKCGQVVGQKHREWARKENEKAVSDYEKQLAEVQAHNAVIKKEMERLQNDYLERDLEIKKAMRYNEKQNDLKHRLELELAGVRDEFLQKVAPEPPIPAEQYSEIELQAVEKAVEEYETRRVQYDFVKRQCEVATVRRLELHTKVLQLDQQIDRLKRIETAVNELPTKELGARLALFEAPGIRIDLSEGFEVYVDEIPWQLASTGEKMKLGMLFASRINSKMPRPINMFFLDDSDLLDVKLLNPGIQMFVAEVEAGRAELNIIQEKLLHG